MICLGSSQASSIRISRQPFLGHGYRFFAPNPGPSHLVRYEVEFADGRTESHRFPDTQEQWPRLLYHRHFMVAEQVNQLASIPTDQEFAEELREREQLIAELRSTGDGAWARNLEQVLFSDRAAFDHQRKLRDGLLDGIAQYYLRFHQAESIRIYSVRHPIPAPAEVASGFQLNEPDSYLERLVYQWPIEEISTEELP